MTSELTAAQRYISAPLRLDAHGHTATVDRAQWLRDLIRAVLFTSPGERVHRPDFGSGAVQLLFAPQDSELAGTLQFLVRGALTQWLGHLIDVTDVTATATDNRLDITVSYADRHTGHTVTDTFASPDSGGMP